MQFRYTIWQKTHLGHVEPIPTISPSGITSSEWAREDARKLVIERGIAAHSLTIENTDGDILEEWRWRRRKWMKVDPIAPRNGVPRMPIRGSGPVTLDIVNALRDEEP